MTAAPPEPAATDTVWHSPAETIAGVGVAICYQRRGPEEPWLPAGLLVSDSPLGSGSLKRIPWRRLAAGPTAPGIVWDRAPTLDALADAYGPGGRLRPDVPGATPAAPHPRPQQPPPDPVSATERPIAARDRRLRAARRAEHLRRVAAAYSAALRDTGRPVAAVAEGFGVPRTTAANWVRAARAAGYLTPTTRGRAST